ncbi:helix-turn-helix domain-containing protein [Lentilactobacillus kribbianus]|uniref:helix-turn-helix domain-containing protein n=1 Tax=Lentilactobacillus kribbianus TaxID=2729622 RepID=UPI001FE76505|nr:helix-turn-helix transcriptional regulator [Lentilactobacillus kribbianus]
MDEKTQKFVIRLEDLKEQSGLTQTEIAKRIGIDRTAYSKIKNGTRKLSSSEAKKLANLFNVSTDYLLGESSKTSDSTPDWATEKDISDLHDFLATNGQMTYKGMDLTQEQRERVDQIITQVFWEELEKDKRKNER